jgi:hypothetical protein
VSTKFVQSFAHSLFVQTPDTLARFSRNPADRFRCGSHRSPI